MNIYPDTTFLVALRFFNDVLFATFDTDQLALAEAAGLDAVFPS